MGMWRGGWHFCFAGKGLEAKILVSQTAALVREEDLGGGPGFADSSDRLRDTLLLWLEFACMALLQTPATCLHTHVACRQK